MAARAQSRGGFDRIKAWVVGLTGVVVVIPALVNAVYDVYAAVAKVPRTDAERINAELFQKHFNKQPVATLPVPSARRA